MKHLLIALLILCSFFSSGNKLCSQNTDDPTSDLKTWIDAQFTAGLDSFNIAGATIVLMQGDSVLHLNGYGVADIASNTPVNCNTSMFGVAYVSKTFVATAIMQLVEDGKIALDRDVNNYLTSFQLEYNFNDSITVRHLLTHTAGLEDRNIGTAVHNEEDVIPLAHFLKTRMAQQIRPAGVAVTYSNHGYALLGLIVEEVSGLPFHAYIKQRILNPLEMNSSGFKRQDELKENYVTSYLQKGEQLMPYPPNFQLYYPAASLSTTASDMGHYLSMFLNNGHFKGNQVLDSTTVVQMHETAFKHYEKSEIGKLLGFAESRWNGVRLVKHDGGLQGFASELTLVPEKNIGFFLCVNSSSMPEGKSRIFINQFTHNLLSRLIPDSIIEKETAKVSPRMGSVDEPLEKFTGTYRWTRHAYTTFDKLSILLFGYEIEVAANDNTLEIVEWNDQMVPISDLTFHSKYDRYVAFGRDTKGEISYFFVDDYSYNKLKWYEPVKFQMLWVGSIVLILLIFILASAVRQLFVRNKKSHLIKAINFSLAALIVLFIAVLAFGLIKIDPQEFFNGIPLLIKIALVIPFLIIPLAFAAIYFLIKAIRFRELGAFDLIYQSLIVVAVLFFIPWLTYYNLIGFNY